MANNKTVLAGLKMTELESLLNMTKEREAYYRNMIELNSSDHNLLNKYSQIQRSLTLICKEIEERIENVE